MLHFIRERAQGWIAWVVVGLISIPFALWGINQYFTGGGQANIALVNGTEISLQEFQRALASQKDRIRSMLGDQVNEDMVDRMVRAEDVVNYLVDSELLLQAAQDMNFGIHDLDLSNRIRSIPDFQTDGKFSQQKYQDFLRRRPGFESLFRQDLIRDQVRNGIMGTAMISEQELDLYLRLKDQQRSFRYVEVSAPKYITEVSVSEQDMKDYYDQNKQRFMVPEQLSLQYVELKLDDIKKDFSVSEKEINEAYLREKDRFGIPEERRASHILIAADGEDQTGRDAARVKAQDILKQVREGGKDFATLAKEFSEDPGSKDQGGDLGFFAKGVMTPAFEDAVFALNKGDTSEVVATDFGFHIIRLTDIRSSSIKPLEQVKGELKDMLMAEKAQARMREKQEQLDKLAFDDASTLDGVSKNLGLKIQETKLFSRMGAAPGIAGKPKIKEAAFSKEVLEDGYNSKVLEAAPGHLVVIRKKEHVPEKLKEFDEVKSSIEKILRKDRAEVRAGEEGKALLSKVEQGDSLKETAKAKKLPFFADKRISRNEQKVDRYIVEMLFRMNKTEGKPAVKAVGMTNGNTAIVELTGVYDGDPATAEEAKKSALRRDLGNIYSSSEFEQYLAALKASADVRLFLENIK